MFEFVLEAYQSRETTDLLAQRVEQVAAAAGQVSAEGAGVRLLHVIFLPEDETCFYLYESASAGAVRAAATRAGLSFERMAQAVSIRPPSGPRWHAATANRKSHETTA